MRTKPEGKLVKIKVVPSDRYLETQDPSKEYYRVLMISDDGYIVSGMTGSGTAEEVNDYIEKNFESAGPGLFIEDKIQMVMESLEEDKEFLKKEVHKRSQEISIHLGDAIEFLKKLYHYEMIGLPDMEFGINE